MEQFSVTAVSGAECGRGGVSEVTLKVPRTHWRFECHDAEGNLKWEAEEDNLVFDAGINDLLTQYFKGAAYTAAWFVGLVTSPATYAAADTMAAHAGWAENVAYSEAVRQTLTLGAVAAKSVNNSASKAVFTANGAATISGAFLCSNSTKGGTTGVLYCGVDFTGGAKTLAAADTISVTMTLSGA